MKHVSGAGTIASVNNNNNKQGQYSVQRPTLGQRLTKDNIATAIHWHNAVRQITNKELPLTQLCAPRPPTRRIYHPGATLPTPSCIPDCRVRGPRPVARRAGATPAQSTRAPLGPPPSWRWYPLGPAPPLGAVALPHCWSSVPHGCPADGTMQFVFARDPDHLDELSEATDRNLAHALQACRQRVLDEDRAPPADVVKWAPGFYQTREESDPARRFRCVTTLTDGSCWFDSWAKIFPTWSIAAQKRQLAELSKDPAHSVMVFKESELAKALGRKVPDGGKGGPAGKAPDAAKGAGGPPPPPQPKPNPKPPAAETPP